MLIVTLAMFSTWAFAQKKEKIIYEYKKYEKFDFDNLAILGDKSSPGDISITPRFRNKFKNMLPYRKNFNPELRRAVENIK